VIDPNNKKQSTVGNSFSSWSHLVRLGLVLILVLGGLQAVFMWVRPDSWNTNVWYRGETLEDMKLLPMYYGGNESCSECHEDDGQMGPGHLKLSCESCHGPIVDHITEGVKSGAAIVVLDSPLQCLNCHSEQVNRPIDFPQYRYSHGDQFVRKQKSEKGGRFCLDCHEAHSPELYGPLWM